MVNIAVTRDYYTSILQKLLNPEKIEQDVAVEVNETEPVAVDASMEEPDEVGAQSDIEPTHYSQLDVNTLKVSDLRNELAARKLDTKGLKVNLVARLQSALDEEKKADEPEENKQEEPVKAEQSPTKTTSPTATQAKDESKELSEKERRRLERLYRLGDKPAIIIHPNKLAKGGRFDCHRVSLFSLLDYRAEDQKEHNFEVSLFAEQFHEMLQRDAAFTIFKAIHDAPEKENKPDQDVKYEDIARNIDILKSLINIAIGATNHAIVRQLAIRGWIGVVFFVFQNCVFHFLTTVSISRLENGLDGDEPEAKRRRNDSQNGHEVDGDEVKTRRLRRTVDPSLLFAFTYFDMGRAGYIHAHDLCDILHLLGLLFSRTQMRKLVSKVISRRDHVQYHNMTDADIVEGDEKDVVTMNLENQEDVEVIKMMALGNRALFDMSAAPIPAKIVIGGGNSDAMLARLEQAEDMKQRLEFQFFQIKSELEKTRVQVNSFKDTEDELRSENRDLTSRLKNEQKQMHEYKSLYNTYTHIMRSAREQLDRVLFDINKQFDKEKAKRDAEKAAAEAEKAKVEEDANKVKSEEKEEDKVDENEKSEEKDWEVVDTV